MNRKTTSKVVPVTAEEARHYRRSCHYEGQRKFSILNLERLRQAMEKDVFVQGTAITFCALPDGKMYLVNGNHTLEALAQCGITQVLTIVVIEVANMDEVADVYMTFDIHKPRSWMDALHAKGLDQEIPLSQYVMPALGLIMQNFRYDSKNVEANSSRNDRFRLMEAYRAEATAMYEALSGADAVNRKLCLRRAVLGIALETFKYQASTALEFWHGLAYDDMLARNDPRKVLLKYLLANRITGPIENFRQSRACALAWNAYYKANSLTVLKPGAGSKLVLLGTPWGTTKAGQAMAPAPRPETYDGDEPETPPNEAVVRLGDWMKRSLVTADMASDHLEKLQDEGYQILHDRTLGAASRAMLTGRLKEIWDALHPDGDGGPTFRTGIETGPEGSKPVTYYKH